MSVNLLFGSTTLRDGTAVSFRPVSPDDEPLIAEAIRTSSPRTLLHRFFTPLRQVAPEELRRLLAIDPRREFAVAGEIGQGGGRRIICGARYVRLDDPGKAEIALTVHDDFQGCGLGRWMLEQLIEVARKDGIRTFVAHVLETNEPMLRLLRRVASQRRVRSSAGEYEIEFDLH